MEGRKQFRLVGTGKGTLHIDRTDLHKVVGDTTDELGGDLEANQVTEYRSSFEADEYIYSGYLLETAPVIIRVKDNIKEIAQDVTDLEVDWSNRLALIYI